MYANINYVDHAWTGSRECLHGKRTYKNRTPYQYLGISRSIKQCNIEIDNFKDFTIPREHTQLVYRSIKSYLLRGNQKCSRRIGRECIPKTRDLTSKCNQSTLLHASNEHTCSILRAVNVPKLLHISKHGK